MRRQVVGVALLATVAGARPAATQDIVVAPGTAVPTLTAALARARPGDHIVVAAGRYAEPVITVSVPRVRIEGRGWPEFSGSGAHTVLVIAADSVTVRGLVVTNSGFSGTDDRAGILVRDARDCLVDSNRVLENAFGIYLSRSVGCVVRGNVVAAARRSEYASGNAIHLWYSPNTRLVQNRINGHRDGLYFEFSPHSRAEGNEVVSVTRYGLHFMYSDTCRYEDNVFERNGSGVAVMFSHAVVIRGNRFDAAVGPAAYGLLLKEIYGGEVSANVFRDNSTGMHLEGSMRLVVRDNRFVGNGFAIRVLGSAELNRFVGNEFAGNAFDVVTNTRSSTSTFDRNWWDGYRGYDLDRDGVGDVPFRPVRLFALVVEQHPPALLLLRSPLVGILDAAERVVPVLAPNTLVDHHPLMRPPR
jgi:nitrous oxidase accessory protein